MVVWTRTFDAALDLDSGVVHEILFNSILVARDQDVVLLGAISPQWNEGFSENTPINRTFDADNH